MDLMRPELFGPMVLMDSPHGEDCVGQKRKVLTPDQSPLHQWGAELRAFRDRRGLSLAKLGILATHSEGRQWKGTPESPCKARTLEALI